MFSFPGRVTALLSVLFFALAATSPAQAAPSGNSAATPSKAKSTKTSVRILGTGQKALIRSGLAVRVKGKPGTRVVLRSTSSSFDEGTRPLARTRTIRIGNSGAVTVTLRLTAGARRAAASCAARSLRVEAGTSRGRATNRATMVRQRPDCRLAPVNLRKAGNCEFIAQPKEGLCMLPFPSDFYTVRDRNSPTGKRIAFKLGGMPKNKVGNAIGVGPYSWSDGFSQGQGILVKVPGLETAEALEANDFVELDQLSRYAETDQKAVVIDARTGKRWPIWVQIDSNAATPEETALMISPSVNFDEKGRYIVALRNLVDAEGDELEAPDAFRYYRDAIPSRQSTVNQRRSHFEGIFRTLKRAKIKRSELYLAWDFTVASNENNYKRALHMRDEAFAALGDTTMADQIVQGDAPGFTVTSQPAEDLSPEVARRVVGTFTVPCFLEPNCNSGGTMDLTAQGLPQQNGTYQANFQCIIPPVGLDDPNPPKLRPMIYGHGLLGDAIEVVFSPVSRGLAQDHESIVCATNEIGMAFDDRIFIVPQTLTDMNGFSKLADRLQQGLLNELFLARLMYHPDGLGTDPAFQDGDGVTPGDSVIRTDHVHYVGASQGGIMGGPLTALSPDFIQSGLVVGAMNYSTLLTRSSNWAQFGSIFNSGYPSDLAKPLILNIAQMLWDRGEPNGYAHVTTDNPPPNTPEHNVLLIPALGDHQVTNFASDVMARTMGMKTNEGAIDPLRWPAYEDLWNIPRIGAEEYPYRGSSIVYFDGGPYRLNPLNLSQDIGTGTPPYENVAPNPEWEDPHGAPRGGAVGPVAMLDTFLQPNGFITDACSGQPCRAPDWDGDFDAVLPVP
jgi:hypothetical protein